VKRRRLLSFVAFLILAAGGPARPARAAEPDWNAPLPVDPSLHIGALPNGLAYWIKSHNRPPGKVGFWLHVSSGSVNEEDDQRGLAHYLEHLAFDGTANFPPGTLVKFFESIGLRFGTHQNAFTGFDQTTYLIHLPNTQDETARKGLLCLADYAFRQSLLTDQIDKERSVILEEMRARKGVGQRLWEKMLPLMAPGSRAAARLPIGVEETVRAADLPKFKAYYGKWYRPDNATLLAVGDLPAEQVAKLAGEEFRDWKAEGPRPAAASPGVQPYTTTRAATITDPELSQTECMVTRMESLREVKTLGAFRARLIEDLGCWIMDRRLEDLIKKGEAPFQTADVNVSNWLNACTKPAANATGQPERWQPMLKGLLTELKRAREHGFQEQEFADARTEFLAGAEKAANDEATWDARAFLGRMNHAVSEGRQPMSEAQRLACMKQVLPFTALGDVNAAFRGNFAPDARLLLVILPEKEGVTAPKVDEILATAKEAEAAPVAALEAKARPKSLLEKEPERGEIKNADLEKDLGILSVTFENGVRCHFRSMDYKKNEVYVRITLAGGTLRETAENRGAGEVAALAFQQPSSRRLSSIQVRDLMVGRKVSVSGWVGDDQFGLRIAGSADDLEDGLRLAYLLLTEGRLEPSALKVWREQKEQELNDRRRSVEAQLSERLQALLSGNDPRFAWPAKEQIERLTLEAGQDFLDEHLRRAPIEASIVGDLSRERALELARRYLGGLPARKTRDADLDKLRKLQPPKGPLFETVVVETITDRAVVAVGWRGADWKDVKERRLLQIAAQVLQPRLREDIREKRGLTYSVWAFASAARAYPGTGFFEAYSLADPRKAQETLRLTRELVEQFARTGPSEEEMATVRKQLVNELEVQLKEPSYWSNLLADLDYHGTKLSDVKELVAKMTSYSRDDVRGAVQKYVKDERRIEVLATPKPGAAPAKKEEAKKEEAKPAGK
jgi:zinc protease